VQSEISGWGNYPRVRSKVFRPESLTDLRTLLDQRTREPGGVLARGMGRSYGDASLNECVLDMRRFNNFLSFDRQKGILKCESGVTLEEILDLIVPCGWFLPTTPGTKYTSVGGAISSDVHGKNHHRDGSISRFVRQFTLMLANGEIAEVRKDGSPELFWATAGGLGLTGLILDVEIQLKPVESSYIFMKLVKVKNLDELFVKLDEYDQQFTYSLAWVDSFASRKNIARGVLMFGNHAGLDELPETLKKSPLPVFNPTKFSVPFYLPSFFLGKTTMKAMDRVYYASKRNTEGLSDYDSFFYPLDAVLHWNRVYGRRGFVQYQFVVPFEEKSAIAEVLEKVARRGAFLTVLKRMGTEEGILSFPMKGYTFAMDFPLVNGTRQFLKEIDNIVLSHGGRVYLSKDALLDEETFKQMYEGKWQRWIEAKSRCDPDNMFTSGLSRRIGLRSK
jgi:decaprenylphospho-beta-D-ribofuranose 2-oxidase